MNYLHGIRFSPEVQSISTLQADKRSILRFTQTTNNAALNMITTLDTPKATGASSHTSVCLRNRTTSLAQESVVTFPRYEEPPSHTSVGGLTDLEDVTNT